MGELESNNKYISLKAAAELYGYTRDHLGLMIRRNKLKGIKLGSYYVTTNSWMSDYIKNFADSDHPMSKNKLSNKFLSEILSSKNDSSSAMGVKNIERQPVKSIVQKSVRNNVKNNVMAEPVMDNDLGVKILEALAQHESFSGKTSKTETTRIENAVSTFPHMPYVVLPIRKMENMEREEILKKVE